MARKCRCQICKAHLTTDVAFKVTKGSRNFYYCSEDEYTKVQKEAEARDNCYYTAARIMEVPMITPAMRKEINDLSKFYGYIVIEKTFKAQKEAIRRFLDRDHMGNEFGRVRYIMTIIKGNINPIYAKYMEEQKEITKLFKQSEYNNTSIDVDIMNDLEVAAMPKRKPVSDISAWL